MRRGCKCPRHGSRSWACGRRGRASAGAVRPERAGASPATAVPAAGAATVSRSLGGAADRRDSDLGSDRRHQRGDRNRGDSRVKRCARFLARAKCRPGDSGALAGVHADRARRPRRVTSGSFRPRRWSQATSCSSAKASVSRPTRGSWRRARSRSTNRPSRASLFRLQNRSSRSTSIRRSPSRLR